MNQQYSNSLCRHPSERGSIVTLAAVAMLPLLLIVGLAVDAGNLYRNRLRVQKAADAAVIAALNYRILHGPSVNQAELRNRAEEVALANMINDGLTSATTSNITLFNYNSSIDQAQISLEYNVALFLLPYLPGISRDTGTVGRSATGNLAPANIALILDVSDSMNCPDNQCDCRNANPSTCHLFTSKLDRLKEAVADPGGFLEQFNPSRDKVGLTIFNMDATLNASLSSASNFPALQTSVNGLNASSNTNMCAGFETTFHDVESAGLLNGKEVSYVFFTDGAPTAGTLMFGNNFKFHSYSVLTLEADGSVTNGYSPFIPASEDLMNWASPTPPNNGGNCGSDITCTGGDFGFKIPSTNSGTVYGANINQLSNLKTQYYHCAIAWSDYLRAHRGTVYAVGLGDPVSPLDPTDPYQDIQNQDFARKDYLLNRIANDHHSGYATHADFNFPEYKDYDAIRDPYIRQGLYLDTTQPDELKNLFVKIARTILLRLVQ